MNIVLQSLDTRPLQNGPQIQQHRQHRERFDLAFEVCLILSQLYFSTLHPMFFIALLLVASLVLVATMYAEVVAVARDQSELTCFQYCHELPVMDWSMHAGRRDAPPAPAAERPKLAPRIEVTQFARSVDHFPLGEAKTLRIASTTALPIALQTSSQMLDSFSLASRNDERWHPCNSLNLRVPQVD